MKVHWYCGCFTGPPKWNGANVCEPDECCAEGEVEIDEDEWREGCAMVICPDCGAELSQFDEHLEVIMEKRFVVGSFSILAEEMKLCEVRGESAEGALREFVLSLFNDNDEWKKVLQGKNIDDIKKIVLHADFLIDILEIE